MGRYKGDKAQAGLLSQQAALTIGLQTVPVPAGLELTTPEELTLWGHFTASRIPDDWRRVDLVMLHRVIRLEIELRGLWEQVFDEGMTVEGKFGPVVNPTLTAVQRVQQTQLQLIRQLQLLELPFGLQQQRSKRAKDAETVRNATNGHGGDVLDLLAVSDPVTGDVRYEAKG